MRGKLWLQYNKRGMHMNSGKTWERVNSYYPIVLELPLLLLIVFAFWYSSVHYTLMPAQIPTHFGLNGLPDSWSTKSWGNVLLLPVFTIISYIILSGLTLLQSVHGPQQGKATEERAEALHRVGVQGLFFVKAMIVVALTYLTYGSTQVALARASRLGWLNYGLIFMVSVPGLAIAVRIIIISRNNRHGCDKM
jgi:uncharacterized membrane protein